MVLNIIYPTSQKSSYNPQDLVDFLLSFENKSIKQNSIRINGKVNCSAMTKTNDIQFDAQAGLHSLFQSITISSEKQGIWENNNHYPRYVKSKRQATVDSNDQVAMSNFVNEGCFPIHDKVGQESNNTKYLLEGYPDNLNQYSFSLKPDVSINKTDVNIGYSKTGQMQLSLRLASNTNFFYGNNASTYTYTISDLELQYETLDKDSNEDIIFENIYAITNTMESNNANLSSKGLPNSVSCSVNFHLQESQNSAESNTLASEEPPNVSEVEFSLNDSTTSQLTFKLDSRQEMIDNYIKSWGSVDTRVNGMDLLEQNRLGSPFGIGLSWNTPLDLSKQRFGVNVKSSVNSTNKYSVYLFFRSVSKL